MPDTYIIDWESFAEDIGAKESTIHVPFPSRTTVDVSLRNVWTDAETPDYVTGGRCQTKYKPDPMLIAFDFETDIAQTRGIKTVDTKEWSAIIDGEVIYHSPIVTSR